MKGSVERWREGCGNREKGKRHAIICRSLTSPVYPQSRLTLLIKETIKGPPPERETRDRRKKETGQNHSKKT